MPSKGNLEIYQGDDYAAWVTVTDASSPAPPDLSGYTAQAQIRVGPADQNPQVVAEIAAVIILPNFISLSIPASITTCLSGLYNWDLQLIGIAAGEIVTILAGGVSVAPEVTREASMAMAGHYGH